MSSSSSPMSSNWISSSSPGPKVSVSLILAVRRKKILLMFMNQWNKMFLQQCDELITDSDMNAACQKWRDLCCSKSETTCIVSPTSPSLNYVDYARPQRWHQQPGDVINNKHWGLLWTTGNPHCILLSWINSVYLQPINKHLDLFPYDDVQILDPAAVLSAWCAV